MTVPRAAVEAHVARVLGELLAAARVVPADVAGGLREPLDQAFRAVGAVTVTEADDAATEALLAHAEYRTLLRIHRTLLLSPLWAGEDAATRRDRTEAVRLALDAAREAATLAATAAPTAAGGFGAGTIALGWMAPATGG